MLAKLKNDPSFISLSNVLEKANKAYGDIRDKRENCSNKIAVCQKEIDDTESKLKSNAAEIFRAQNELGDYELKHIEIRAAAREEY